MSGGVEPRSRVSFALPPLPLPASSSCLCAESKAVVAELSPDFEERSRKALTPFPTCLAWSPDGSTLYSGYTDGSVRIWSVGHA